MLNALYTTIVILGTYKLIDTLAYILDGEHIFGN